MNFLIFINAFFQTLFRKIYWLYRTSKIQFGSSTKIKLPLRVEGKGKIIFGNNTSIAERVYLGISEKSTIKFGDNCTLNKDVQIISVENAGLTTGTNINIGKGSRLIIRDHWHFHNSITIACDCQIFSREGNFHGRLEIGSETGIGDGTIMDIAGDLTIGKNVAIGPLCIFYTHDHDYNQNHEIPWKGKPLIGPIVIEDGAWVGAGVIILPGVKIGKGSIVAAGSVLNKNVPMNVIVAGVPAKIVKEIAKEVYKSS